MSSADKTKLDSIQGNGGEDNVIESIKVNGTALPITDKSVDIPIETVDLSNYIQNSASDKDNQIRIASQDVILASNFSTILVDSYGTTISSSENTNIICYEYTLALFDYYTGIILNNSDKTEKIEIGGGEAGNGNKFTRFTSNNLDFTNVKALTGIKTINGQSILGTGNISIDFSFVEIATSLDSITNPQTNKIYLISNDPGASSDNLYTEYIYVSDAFEKIGEVTSSIDLSNYYTKTEIDNKISNNNTHLINTIKNDTKTINGNSIYGSGNIVIPSLTSYEGTVDLRNSGRSSYGAIQLSNNTPKLFNNYCGTYESVEVTNEGPAIYNTNTDKTSGVIAKYNADNMYNKVISSDNTLTSELYIEENYTKLTGNYNGITTGCYVFTDEARTEIDSTDNTNKNQSSISVGNENIYIGSRNIVDNENTTSGIGIQQTKISLDTPNLDFTEVQSVTGLKTVNGQSILGNGNISTSYTLPIASDTVLGGVKVGAGLSINNGVLSANGGGTADAVDWSNVQNKPAFSAVATSGSYNDLTDKPAAYTLPAATNESLGGVILGATTNSALGEFTINADSNNRIYTTINYAKNNTLPTQLGLITKKDYTDFLENYNWYKSITGNDTDSVINKYQEIVNFLDTYTEADTLANILSNKADKTDVNSIAADVAALDADKADKTALDSKVDVDTFDLLNQEVTELNDTKEDKPIDIYVWWSTERDYEIDCKEYCLTKNKESLKRLYNQTIDKLDIAISCTVNIHHVYKDGTEYSTVNIQQGVAYSKNNQDRIDFTFLTEGNIEHWTYRNTEVTFRYQKQQDTCEIRYISPYCYNVYNSILYLNDFLSYVTGTINNKITIYTDYTFDLSNEIPTSFDIEHDLYTSVYEILLSVGLPDKIICYVENGDATSEISLLKTDREYINAGADIVTHYYSMPFANNKTRLHIKFYNETFKITVEFVDITEEINARIGNLQSGKAEITQLALYNFDGTSKQPYPIGLHYPSISTNHIFDQRTLILGASDFNIEGEDLFTNYTADTVKNTNLPAIQIPSAAGSINEYLDTRMVLYNPIGNILIKATKDTNTAKNNNRAKTGNIRLNAEGGVRIQCGEGLNSNTSNNIELITPSNTFKMGASGDVGVYRSDASISNGIFVDGSSFKFSDDYKSNSTELLVKEDGDVYVNLSNNRNDGDGSMSHFVVASHPQNTTQTIPNGTGSKYGLKSYDGVTRYIDIEENSIKFGPFGSKYTNSPGNAKIEIKDYPTEDVKFGTGFIRLRHSGTSSMKLDDNGVSVFTGLFAKADNVTDIASITYPSGVTDVLNNSVQRNICDIIANLKSLKLNTSYSANSVSLSLGAAPDTGIVYDNLVTSVANIGEATSTQAGMMSAEDKTKLNNCITSSDASTIANGAVTTNENAKATAKETILSTVNNMVPTLFDTAGNNNRLKVKAIDVIADIPTVTGDGLWKILFCTFVDDQNVNKVYLVDKRDNDNIIHPEFYSYMHSSTIFDNTEGSASQGLSFFTLLIEENCDHQIFDYQTPA